MQLSDKTIQEFKDIMQKEYGKEYTWEEASEAAQNFLRYAEVCLDIAMKQQSEE